MAHPQLERHLVVPFISRDVQTKTRGHHSPPAERDRTNAINC
jgi:hypothetical protein